MTGGWSGTSSSRFDVTFAPSPIHAASQPGAHCFVAGDRVRLQSPPSKSHASLMQFRSHTPAQAEAQLQLLETGVNSAECSRARTVANPSARASSFAKVLGDCAARRRTSRHKRRAQAVVVAAIRQRRARLRRRVAHQPEGHLMRRSRWAALARCAAAVDHVDASINRTHRLRFE